MSTTTQIEPHQQHEHHPALLHHFDDLEQQRDASTFGMWVFLLTEIMFFGGLFCAYLIFRNLYHPAFVAASNTLDVTLGTINTAVLIGSSLTMAMAVWSAHMGKRMLIVLFLLATMGLGAIFLGIKGIEYKSKWDESHVPGIKFSIDGFVHPEPEPGHKTAAAPLSADMAQHTIIYFGLYFAMTGMHATHMIIGMGIMAFLVYYAYKGKYTPEHYSMIENFGLYWHFVDIVWIFLFPLLYLISRHTPH
ncbi:MAG: cytochrome c oxidase subunit 3 family protein [Acidobacteriaceae bacterium]